MRKYTALGPKIREENETDPTHSGNGSLADMMVGKRMKPTHSGNLVGGPNILAAVTHSRSKLLPAIE